MFILDSPFCEGYFSRIVILQVGYFWSHTLHIKGLDEIVLNFLNWDFFLEFFLKHGQNECRAIHSEVAESFKTPSVSYIQ